MNSQDEDKVYWLWDKHKKDNHYKYVNGESIYGEDKEFMFYEKQEGDTFGFIKVGDLKIEIKIREGKEGKKFFGGTASEDNKHYVNVYKVANGKSHYGIKFVSRSDVPVIGKANKEAQESKGIDIDDLPF